MADDNMDPCEHMSVWNHELAMRRLISLLRQGQSYCTDSECLDNQVQGERQDWGQVTCCANSFLIMFLMMAVAIGMYALGPRRRRRLEEPAKPHRNSTHDNDGAPPTPPTI